MIDQDEAYQAPQRSPEQIPGQESHGHAALAVDRTCHLLPQIGRGIEQGPQFDLAAIEARPAAPPWADGSGERFKGDRVATQPRDQGAAARQSPVGHRGAGVIGVGDHDEGLCDAQRIGEGTEFLGQGAMIAITELYSLVDASRERNGQKRACGSDQDGDHLDGVAHDELGLGVVLRGLMQAFDRRHLAPAFGDFDPVAEQHQAPPEAMGREALQRQPHHRRLKVSGSIAEE